MGPLDTAEAVPSCYSNMWRTQWHYHIAGCKLDLVSEGVVGGVSCPWPMVLCMSACITAHRRMRAAAAPSTRIELVASR